MVFRFMRTIIFFDLPTLTNKNRKDYRKFVKNLKKIGFYMLQESVYCKMSLDEQAAKLSIKKVDAFLPPDGNIVSLTITEKQFADMEILLGKSNTDVLNSVERTIEL